MNRRLFLKSFIGIATISLLPVTSSEARRGGGRVSMGSGLSNGSRYNGPTLTKDQLKQCVIEENRINESSNLLDQKEEKLNAQGRQVDHYSQYSVDRYNQAVNEFNNEGERLNSIVNSFNQKCGDHAYYASDMTTVKRELNIN